MNLVKSGQLGGALANFVLTVCRCKQYLSQLLVICYMQAMINDLGELCDMLDYYTNHFS